MALKVNNLVGFGGKPIISGGAVSAVGIARTDEITDASNSTTYSKTVSIGAADPNRWIAVAYGSNIGAGTPALTTFQLGSNNSDYLDQYDNLRCPCGVGLWNVTTGTSLDLDFTFDATVNGLVATVFRFLSTQADPRHVAAGKATNNSNVSLNVAEQGGVIAAHGSINSSTPAWTGVTGEDVLELSSSDYGATGFVTDISSETGRTVGPNLSSSNTNNRMVAVSLAP